MVSASEDFVASDTDVPSDVAAASEVDVVAGTESVVALLFEVVSVVITEVRFSGDKVPVVDTV